MENQTLDPNAPQPKPAPAAPSALAPQGVVNAQPPVRPTASAKPPAAPQQPDPFGADPAKVQEAAAALQARNQGQEQQRRQAYDSASAEPKRPTEDEMLIHPERAQAFMPLMMAMAALSSRATREPMTAALNNMNAVMKAQIAGDKDLANQHATAMMKQYDAAIEERKQKVAEVDKKLPLFLTDPKAHSEDMRLWLVGQYGTQVADSLMSDPKNLIQHIDAQKRITEKANEHADNLKAKLEGAGGGSYASMDVREVSANRLIDGAQMNSLVKGMGKNATAAAQQITDDAVRILKARGLNSEQIAQKLDQAGITFAAVKSAESALQKISVGQDKVGQKVVKDIANLEKLIKIGNPGDVKFLNTPISAMEKFSGDPAYTAYALQVDAVRTEFARLMNGNGLSVAQLHAGHKEEIAALMDGTMTPKQLYSLFAVMKNDLENTIESNKGASENNLGKIGAPAGGAGATKGSGTAADPIRLD